MTSFEELADHLSNCLADYHMVREERDMVWHNRRGSGPDMQLLDNRVLNAQHTVRNAANALLHAKVAS